MATSRIIGEANRAFAESFTEMFEDTTYSLILGNADRNSNGIVPEKGSYAASANSFYGDFGAVLPEYSNPVPVCKHIPWKQMRFDSWDPTKDQENHAYYCEHRNKVYLCLDNLDGAISGSPPEGTHATPFHTNDGYYWQYLYSISGLMNHYKRTLDGTAWMPVQTRLNKSERDILSSTNPYFLKYKVEEFGANNGGKLVKVVVQEEAKKWVRFDTVRDDMFQLMVDPEESATIRPVFDYIGKAGETDANKRGYQLKKIEVIEGGSGYPMSANMILGFEPSTASQNITGYNSNHIVGGSTSSLDSKIKGPFIYAIASPQDGFSDAVGLLNAYRSMFLVILDPYAIRNYTDATSWNTASLVKNALYNDKPIKDAFPKGKKSAQATYFSAANKVTVTNNSISEAMTSGSKLNSISSGSSSKNTRSTSTVSSSSRITAGGFREIRMTGHGSHLYERPDKLFKEKSPSTFISGGFSIAQGSSNPPTDNVLVHGVEKTPLSWGQDAQGNWTEVIHTFEFSDITIDEDINIGNSLCLAVLIG